MNTFALPETLFEYLNSVDRIEGWLSPTAGYAMSAILRWQSTRNETGNIAEIGIHHGKSFLPLALSAEPGDRLLAIDCFDAQEANIDGSGKGDLDAFQANLKTWVPDRNIEIISSDSAHVRHRMPDHAISDLRFLSIDGAHTKDMTHNDLEIADLALTPYGICVLDDFMNAWWTGVMSGFFEFTRYSDGLQPVALIPNKLVLARPRSVTPCKTFLRETLGSLLLKTDTELADGTVDFYRDFDSDSAPWADLSGPLERDITSAHK